MARPTKLNDELTKRLCYLIEKGYSYKRACESSGITYVTFNEWMKSAEEPSSQYLFTEFSSKIREAESRCILKKLDLIDSAINEGNVNVAMWYLDRRCEEFKKETNVNLDNKHSGSVKIVELKTEDCGSDD
jgi:transposase